MGKIDFQKYGGQQEFGVMSDEKKQKVVDAGREGAEKVKEKAESVEKGLKLVSLLVEEKLTSLQDGKGVYKGPTDGDEIYAGKKLTKEEAEKYFRKYIYMFCPETRSWNDSGIMGLFKDGLNEPLANKVTIGKESNGSDAYIKEIADLADYLSHSEELIKADSFYFSGHYDSKSEHPDLMTCTKDEALEIMQINLHKAKSQEEVDRYNTIINKIKNDEFSNPSIDEIEKYIGEKGNVVFTNNLELSEKK